MVPDNGLLVTDTLPDERAVSAEDEQFRPYWNVPYAGPPPDDGGQQPWMPEDGDDRLRSDVSVPNATAGNMLPSFAVEWMGDDTALPFLDTDVHAWHTVP